MIRMRITVGKGVHVTMFAPYGRRTRSFKSWRLATNWIAQFPVEKIRVRRVDPRFAR